MIPRFILRRLIAPGGHRLPKLPVLSDIAGMCEKCKTPVIWVKMQGVRQLDGVNRSGEFFHRVCAPQDTYIHRNQRGEQKSPDGNLRPEEYRFWVGSRSGPNGADLAICRSCRGSFYSAMSRGYHFKDENAKRAGMNCPTQLINAYKRLLTNPQCLICKKHRFNHTRWGVPICDSVECETEWKFSQTRYFQLEKALKDARDHALSYKPGDVSIIDPKEEEGCALTIIENKGIVDITHEDGITMTDSWCRDCRMWCRDRRHDEIHQKFILSGGQAVD